MKLFLLLTFVALVCSRSIIQQEEEESENFAWTPALVNEQQDNSEIRDEQKVNPARLSELDADELEEAYETLKVRQSQPARASRLLRQEMSEQAAEIDAAQTNNEFIDEYFIEPVNNKKSANEVRQADEKEEMKSDESSKKDTPVVGKIKQLKLIRKLPSKSEQVVAETDDQLASSQAPAWLSEVDPEELEATYMKWQHEPARAIGSKRRQEIIQQGEEFDDYFVPKSRADESVNLAQRRKIVASRLIDNDQEEKQVNSGRAKSQPQQMFSEVDPDEIESAYENLKRDTKPARSYNWEQRRQAIEPREETAAAAEDEPNEDRYQPASILNEKHNLDEIEQAFVELKKAKAIRRPSLLSKLQEEEKVQDAAAAAAKAAKETIADKTIKQKADEQQSKSSAANSDVSTKITSQKEEKAIVGKDALKQANENKSLKLKETHEVSETLKEKLEDDVLEKMLDAEEEEEEQEEQQANDNLSLEDEEQVPDVDQSNDTDAADWHDYNDENWEKLAEKEANEQQL